MFEKFPGIETIATEIGMSATKLKANFKQYYGQTMFDYYNTKQLNFAKQLLEQHANSIKEIAHMLGYVNASKFSSAFKKHFGMLPSDFIKEQ